LGFEAATVRGKIDFQSGQSPGEIENAKVRRGVLEELFGDESRRRDGLHVCRRRDGIHGLPSRSEFGVACEGNSRWSESQHLVPIGTKTQFFVLIAILVSEKRIAFEIRQRRLGETKRE